MINRGLAFTIAVVIFLTTSIVEAKITYNTINNVKLLRVYDGDTFFVDIPGWPKIIGENVGIRIRGIDTPELKGSHCKKEYMLALEAKKYAEKQLKRASKIVLKNPERGKYFRIVADVYVVKGYSNLSEFMIKQGYAVKYFGGKKLKDWCKND